VGFDKLIHPASAGSATGQLKGDVNKIILLEAPKKYGPASIPARI